MRPPIALAAALFLTALVSACGQDRADDPQAVATTATADPGAAMRATLEDLIRAQAAYHSDHGRFADSTQVLIDRYDFRPQGGATVVVNFQGVQPDWAYLAVAQHPATDGRCEVQHTREVTDQRQIVGQIVCTGV
jgi:hypothetical protein